MCLVRESLSAELIGRPSTNQLGWQRVFAVPAWASLSFGPSFKAFDLCVFLLAVEGVECQASDEEAEGESGKVVHIAPKNQWSIGKVHSRKLPDELES